MTERVTFSASGNAIQGNTLSGIAHAFGKLTASGGRYISFSKSAFDEALKTSDVRAFVNHDTTLLLGRQSAGTVRLSVVPEGLRYEIDLPDTSYAQDLKVLIARGDMSEMSFGIFPGATTTSRHTDGKQVIQHTQVKEIFDISPVSLPAFEGTSISLHSIRRNEMRTASTVMSEMQAIVDLSDAETRSLTDEEVTRYESLEKELNSVNRSAEIAKRHEQYKAPQNTGFPALIKAIPKGDKALEFAFDQYLRTGQKNSDISQLFAQTEGTPSAGGYLVPDGFRQKIVECRTSYGGFMNAAEQLNTESGNPIEWPTFTDSTPETKADIVAEGAASAVGADLTFGTASLGVFRYAATGTGNLPVKVSVELLQDAAFDVSAYVAKQLGERIRRKQAKDVVVGTGSGEPLGILSGTAGTIEADITTYQGFLNLVHALDPEYRTNAKWLFNDATAAAVEGLVDLNGRPLLINAALGIEGRVDRQTLLGYPVIIDNFAPNINTDDVIGIAFGDFREAYVVRHVRDIQVIVNPYSSSNSGYVEYNAWARMGGTIQNTCAFVTGEGV